MNFARLSFARVRFALADGDKNVEPHNAGEVMLGENGNLPPPRMPSMV